MRGTILLLAWGLGLLLTGSAGAKTISITIGQRAELQDGKLAVKITVGNTGDEAAKSVGAILRFGDKQVRGKLHGELAPNASLEEDLSLDVGTLGEGRWPFQVAVDYADLNQYPFQALLVTMIVVGNPPPAKVSVPEIGAEGGITDSGTLDIRFKNLAASAREVSYRVIVPEGLEVTPGQGSVELTGWGESSASVPVVNRTALAGSRYPVFVAVEYDDGGVHQGIVAQGVVEIVTPRNFWESNRTLLLVGAGVLVALWLGLVVRRATSRAA